MYGDTLLPATGGAGVTLFGVGVGAPFWLMLSIITVFAIALAVARMIPRRQV